MKEADLEGADAKNSLRSRLTELERENRKLCREVAHLKNAIVQEKMATITILNQQKASTFTQREQERYLTLLLANSPSIILFLSLKGRIEFCTEYFIAKARLKDTFDILGHTLTEALSCFLDDASHKKLLEHICNVTHTNTSFTFDITFRFDRDGTPEDYTGLLVPMKDEEENSSGIMLMFHDVTDIKRSREEALAASKLKSAFLSNMSHEIRTPLNAIIGMTFIGKREGNLQSKDDAFENIESASAHLLGVINDILDISKIESGKMELSHIVFDFSQMLDRVLSVIMPKIKENQQRLSVDIDPDIPQKLLGDDQRLAQVITNILSNASKFTPAGGFITFKAELLESKKDACLIKMSVRDSGIGMSEQEQGKLFHIFQQAEAGTARKYGGSGLGLAISKRILEMMEGDIWVESEKGRGSCFFFTARLTIPDQVTAKCALQPDSCDEEQGCDFSGRVILLADDIDINLKILIALLRPTRITVDTAKNGAEAVDAFIANPNRYDLIFMDVQMPEIDGLQATRMIRALNTPRASTIPIIAMTANVFKEDIALCVDAGMNDHLGKPVVIKDVLKMLSHYLRTK